jgi:DNA-binding IclR family transcriptional regulator
MPSRNDIAGAQSLHRAMGVLRLIARHNKNGIRFVDISEKLGLTRPTIHRMLKSLQTEGLIEQDRETHLYHLGTEAFVLGQIANERFGIGQAGRHSLSRLVQQSGDTALLTVRRNFESMILLREEGSFQIRTHTSQPGDRNPLGIGAGSLAILATLSDEEIEVVLRSNKAEIARRYPMFTPKFIYKIVAETRERGHSLNPGWIFPGSWAIGIPILNKHGGCDGALALAGIESRIGPPRSKQIVAMLLAEASNLADSLGSGSYLNDTARSMKRTVARRSS